MTDTDMMTLHSLRLPANYHRASPLPEGATRSAVIHATAYQRPTIANYRTPLDRGELSAPVANPQVTGPTPVDHSTQRRDTRISADVDRSSYYMGGPAPCASFPRPLGDSLTPICERSRKTKAAEDLFERQPGTFALVPKSQHHTM